MKFGMLGIALAVAMIFVGFLRRLRRLAFAAWLAGWAA